MAPPLHYERHRPEQTALYRLVQQHSASFIVHREASTGSELPRFIKDEFDAFLECGILAHGFLRLRCGECGHDRLLAFSCKRRGFCPSCGARRMSQTAAHLVDHVIPHVPVRQWVLSLPISLRVLLAAQPEIVTPVLQVVQSVITRHLLDDAGLGADEGQGGAVTLIQRFGSAANLNIHLHCLVLDGVYRCGADGAPAFVEAAAPTDDELHALLQTVIARLMKMLTRRGVLVEDTGQTYLAEPDVDGEQARALRPLQAAAVTYRIAFGPRAGQKVLTLRGAMPREDWARQPLCADIDGFSLHAAVRVEAYDRKRLEQLCRYITRPALSDERVQLNAAGQVELKLETPWRDGATHLLMSPLWFMQRLAALVPRPRLHLIRFDGVLAPNARLHRQLPCQFQRARTFLGPLKFSCAALPVPIWHAPAPMHWGGQSWGQARYSSTLAVRRCKGAPFPLWPGRAWSWRLPCCPLWSLAAVPAGLVFSAVLYLSALFTFNDSFGVAVVAPDTIGEEPTAAAP